MSVAGRLREAFAGRRVLILGLGITGRDVATILAGAGAEVFASDEAAVPEDELRKLRSAGVAVERGSHELARRWLAEVDCVLPSPGIPPGSGILSEAFSRDVPVLSELDIAYDLVDVPVVAVTGTKGKTTVTRLIRAIMQADGRKAVDCGNLEKKFLTAVVAVPDADVYVVEASSFALAFCERFRPRVAAVTNFAPDHLDWHASMKAYLGAKAQIAVRQTADDMLVYPSAQPELADLGGGATRIAFGCDRADARWAVWSEHDDVVADLPYTSARVHCLEPMRERGRHFVLNTLTAAGAALAMGAGEAAIGKAVGDFVPDPHTMELVGEIWGVRFVDDSKATNPHATAAALAGRRNVVLIAGGRNKGMDLGMLAEHASSLRAAVLIGESAEELAAVFGRQGVQVELAKDMEEAVDSAYRLARSGDTVLLSPACASFDMFRSYSHRGQVFRQACDDLSNREKR